MTSSSAVAESTVLTVIFMAPAEKMDRPRERVYRGGRDRRILARDLRELGEAQVRACKIVCYAHAHTELVFHHVAPFRSITGSIC